MEAMNKSIPNAHNVNFNLDMLEVMITRLNAATSAFEGASDVNDKIDHRMKQLNYIIDAVRDAECLVAALKSARQQLSLTPVIVSSSLNS